MDSPRVSWDIGDASATSVPPFLRAWAINSVPLSILSGWAWMLLELLNRVVTSTSLAARPTNGQTDATGVLSTHKNFEFLPFIV